jgi:hypothetical protein
MRGRDCSNLVFETLDEYHLLLSYQTTTNPTDAEWDAWMAAADALKKAYSDFRLLVFTDGGCPNKRQLDRLTSTRKGMPRAAIVASSAALRFAASLVTFFNPKIRCFPPTQLERALVHIGLPGNVAATTVEFAVGSLRRATEAPPDEA